MLLKVDSIKHSFARQIILDDISFSLDKGESLSVIGASGCGKSTLLNIVLGLEKPDEGEVFWNKDRLSSIKKRNIEKKRLSFIGLLKQDPLLDPRLSAEENCLLPMVFQSFGLSKNDYNDRVSFLLSKLGLGEMQYKKVSCLSSGQQMRVALVRALLHKPDLLIADEPTGTLDDITAKEISDSLFSLAKEEKFAMILATHDLSLADKCDKTIALEMRL